MTITIRARLAVFAIFLLCSGLADAMPDAILAQILQSHNDWGADARLQQAGGRVNAVSPSCARLLLPVEKPGQPGSVRN